jgi:hypothetical protein
MRSKYAILIDAGFLKRMLGSQEHPLTSTQVVQFTNILVQNCTAYTITMPNPCKVKGQNLSLAVPGTGPVLIFLPPQLLRTTFNSSIHSREKTISQFAWARFIFEDGW